MINEINVCSGVAGLDPQEGGPMVRTRPHTAFPCFASFPGLALFSGPQHSNQSSSYQTLTPNSETQTLCHLSKPGADMTLPVIRVTLRHASKVDRITLLS